MGVGEIFFLVKICYIRERKLVVVCFVEHLKAGRVGGGEIVYFLLFSFSQVFRGKKG
jgi:hypothetical protein